MKNIKDLEILFDNKAHLDHALTHRSWINENPNKRTSNERLEFLGDAILEFVVSTALYEQLPNKEEGYLTALRANLVNTKNLSEHARSLSLGKALYLSKGEEESGGRDNPSLLADTVEAIIGALYLDGGLEKVKLFINNLILKDINKKIKLPLKDAKSRLQELIQAKGHNAPRYIVLKEEGPDHDKTFTIQVVVNNNEKGSIASGKSKAEAEQNAAEIMLKSFK